MIQPMQRKHRSCGQRGVAMIIALFLVVIALLVAIAVLTNTTNAANSSLGVQTKNETFNAAETGLNAAIYQVDANPAIASKTTNQGSLGAYTYNWEIVYNNLTGSKVQQVTELDTKVNNTINVQPQQAYIAGWASSITGGRTVYVEAIVVPNPPTQVTGGAIIAGKTAQISHEQITDMSGKHGGDIHGQTITSNGGGQTPDGKSYATCNVQGCNAITGYDGKAYIDWAPPVFLTAAQLATIQSSGLTQAKSGGSNVYVNGDWSGAATWGTNGSNCTVYINGNVTLSGNSIITNYCTTTVVTGNWTMIGSSQYTIVPASTQHALYILGTGGATFDGTTNTAGFVYTANGPITINGSGGGSFTGVLYTPYDVTMNGGGGSNFFYNPAQDGPLIPNPNVVEVAQWEY